MDHRTRRSLSIRLAPAQHLIACTFRALSIACRTHREREKSAVPSRSCLGPSIVDCLSCLLCIVVFSPSLLHRHHPLWTSASSSKPITSNAHFRLVAHGCSNVLFFATPFRP